MARGDPRDWMWSEALQMLARAEGRHREVFRPRVSPQAEATWEPPVDVLETDDAVLILLALPGVDAAQVQVVIEDGVLMVSGERVLPEELHRAVIHRLELPELPKGFARAGAAAAMDAVGYIGCNPLGFEQ